MAHSTRVYYTFCITTKITKLFQADTSDETTHRANLQRFLVLHQHRLLDGLVARRQVLDQEEQAGRLRLEEESHQHRDPRRRRDDACSHVMCHNGVSHVSLNRCLIVCHTYMQSWVRVLCSNASLA